MRNLRTILVSCALAAGLAACGGSGEPFAPEAPRYDGGTFGIGSGGRTTSSDTTTVAPSSTETTTEDAPAERGGGYTIGSGG